MLLHTKVHLCRYRQKASVFAIKSAGNIDRNANLMYNL